MAGRQGVAAAAAAAAGLGQAGCQARRFGRQAGGNAERKSCRWVGALQQKPTSSSKESYRSRSASSSAVQLESMEARLSLSCSALCKTLQGGGDRVLEGLGRRLPEAGSHAVGSLSTENRSNSQKPHLCSSAFVGPQEKGAAMDPGGQVDVLQCDALHLIMCTHIQLMTLPTRTNRRSTVHAAVCWQTHRTCANTKRRSRPCPTRSR